MRRLRHLVCAAWLACSATAPQAHSQAADAAAKAPKFEVASIRMIPADDVVPLPGSPFSPPGVGVFTIREVTLAMAIAWAFGLDQDRISGGPDWLDHQFYEISAKPEGDVGLSYAQIRPLMQQLLEDRFHLTYHRATKQVKGYVLVSAKGGPKLTLTKGGSNGFILSNRIQMSNVSVQNLAGVLSHVLGQPVADLTGLKGNYDIRLDYAPMDGTESTLPSISTALEEQLGLELEKRQVPVEMFVIDHVDRVPTPN